MSRKRINERQTIFPQKIQLLSFLMFSLFLICTSVLLYAIQHGADIC